MVSFRPAAPTAAARILQVALVLVALIAGGAGCLVLLAPHHVAYRLTAEALTVEAPLGFWEQGRRFERGAVRGARAVTLTGQERYAGTGLPDFCLGRWGQRGIGEVWQATTCGPDAVLLDIDGQAVVLSPDDREAFLGALQGGEVGDFAAAAPPPSRALGGLRALGVLMAVIMLGVVAMMALSPGRLLYSVDGDVLLVRTVWGVRRVSLKGAAVRAAPGIRLGWRLFGLGMPGQQLGWYRVEGRTVLVYLTSADSAVWVEPAEGRAVLLSPQDVDGLIAACRRAVTE